MNFNLHWRKCQFLIDSESLPIAWFIRAGAFVENKYFINLF